MQEDTTVFLIKEEKMNAVLFKGQVPNFPSAESLTHIPISDLQQAEHLVKGENESYEQKRRIQFGIELATAEIFAGFTLQYCITNKCINQS